MATSRQVKSVEKTAPELPPGHSYRKCPGCEKESVFPNKNKYCSGETCIAAKKKRDRALTHAPADLNLAVKNALRHDAITKEAMAFRFYCTVDDITREMDILAALGYPVESRGSFGWRIGANNVVMGNRDQLIIHPASQFNNQWYTFGIFGDNHSGSRHERVDVVKALYDRFEEEGVKHVFHTGNMLEGEMRLNKHDISVFGMDAQISHFLETLPEKKGITTHFVTGDDHEGWYQRNEGIEIGRHIAQSAIGVGRKDLHYLGYVEADVVLRVPGGERLMRIMHPGGGAAYALSYSAQKIVESFQGGEKPAILFYGHYHKFDYNYYREVYTIGTGCCVDQSIFMRKQKIQAHVGGLIVRIHQAPDGAINRLQVEWIPFYDRGYYSKPRSFGLAPNPKGLVFDATGNPTSSKVTSK